MTHISNELPTQRTDMVSPAVIAGEGRELQLNRREVLGLLGKALATATAISIGTEIIDPARASAETATDEPTSPPEPLTPEERAKLRAETAELESRTELQELQQKQLQKTLDPPSFLDEASKFISSIATPAGLALGVIGAAWVGGTTVTRYFTDRRRDRETKEEAMRLEEDGRYADVINKIGDTFGEIRIAEAELAGEPANYATLHLAYSQLESFALKERFAPQIFNVTTALLRDRAKALTDMSSKKIEARLNADRELYRLLAMVAPNLQREDDDGNPLLPNASGIGLNGMRYLRNPLERLELEGAHLQNLTITGSLAGSQCKLARFDGSTFGEPDNVCDLRGTDLSKASLNGATFAHVLIDEHTQFGTGQEGNPSATLENIMSDDTLTQEEVEKKVRIAQTTIREWQQAQTTDSAEQ